MIPVCVSKFKKYMSVYIRLNFRYNSAKIKMNFHALQLTLLNFLWFLFRCCLV